MKIRITLLTGLEANTKYTGKIIPKTVEDTSSKSSKNAKKRIELDPINFSVKTKNFSVADENILIAAF